ncbi:MAG: hypothetical protein KAQ96_14455, partial [Thermoplasmata archaeon]|nr:hypothetical protein [Thermoplasmata archaeon]
LKMDLTPGKHYFRCEVSDGKNTTASEWVTFNIESVETPSPLGFIIISVVLFISILLSLVFRCRTRQGKAY